MLDILQKSLEEQIIFLKKCDDAYYNSGSPLISDADYDALKEVIKLQNPDHEYFEAVGAPVKGDKVKLPYVLGSLTKVKPDTIDKWIKNDDSDEYLLTAKADGVSFYVLYEDGEVTQASTRGDGYEGHDITEKARIFCPKIDSNIGYKEFRAEAVMTKDDFERLNEVLETPLKTRRNAVSGIINRDDFENCEYITPIFYEYLNAPSNMNEIDRMKAISSCGLKTVYNKIMKKSQMTSDNLKRVLEVMKNVAVYDIDGVVITAVDSQRENVYYPKKKVAFKVNQEAVECTVTEVKWDVGRSGKLTPVVHIEPTEIQGVTVSKCTGFNYGFISENSISKGAVIGIVRSGDVIPYIVDIIEKSDVVRNITRCPSCNGKLTLSDTGIDLYCHNKKCGENTYKRVEHFLRTLGAENITIKTLKKLGIDSLEKAYTFDEFEAVLVEGMGTRRVSQIKNEIEKTKNVTPERLLWAFGIKGIGEEVSKDIVKNNNGKIFGLNEENLLKINGIGSKIASNYLSNIDEWEETLNDLGFFKIDSGVSDSTTESNTEVSGKIFTLTGAYHIKRNIIQDLIQGQGGFVKSMTKKTDVLVCADPSSTSSKMQKARKYGTKIISYDDLMTMLGEDNG